MVGHFVGIYEFSVLFNLLMIRIRSKYIYAHSNLLLPKRVAELGSWLDVKKADLLGLN